MFLGRKAPLLCVAERAESLQLKRIPKLGANPQELQQLATFVLLQMRGQLLRDDGPKIYNTYSVWKLFDVMVRICTSADNPFRTQS